MANDRQPLPLTPISSAFVKVLHKEATNKDILKFLTDLRIALNQPAKPDELSSRQAWVPDDFHNLGHTDKYMMMYTERPTAEASDRRNRETLYMTDVASIMIGEGQSIMTWLEQNSPPTSPVRGILSDISKNELLDQAFVEKGNLFDGPDGVVLEAKDDGYSERLLGPNADLTFPSIPTPYRRLKDIVEILMEAAVKWQVLYGDKEGPVVQSMQAIINKVANGKPLDTWPLVRELAEALGEYS